MTKFSDEQIQECIENCVECHSVCLTTFRYCLEKGERYTMRNHAGLLAECAQICQMHADSMLIRSEFHSALAAVCARICERCAEECEEFSDDSIMRNSAKVCRRCAQSCHGMEERMAA